jgi:hypothetical protein
MTNGDRLGELVVRPIAAAMKALADKSLHEQGVRSRCRRAG